MDINSILLLVVMAIPSTLVLLRLNDARDADECKSHWYAMEVAL